MKSLLSMTIMCAIIKFGHASYDPNVLPKGREYFDLREGLANCQLKFEREKSGRIAFLGGSITQSDGWRNMIINYFYKKFPGTTFDIVSAGIGSLGSVPHAFRLERDVLSRGPVDLLFVEAAVNDASNIPDRPEQMLRGMEGIVRHARLANPLTDIIHMHFVMPEHMRDYNNGQIPVAIVQHEKVAQAYGNPSLNLALEVTHRINAEEFSWTVDFVDLHPSPFGHQLYSNSIQRMLDSCFKEPLAQTTKAHLLPGPLDLNSYDRGRLTPVTKARLINGFSLDPSWRPADNTKTRPGFVDVPALVGTKVGSEFEVSFEGNVVGLLVTSGPDSGQIDYSIDGSTWRTVETFTQWSHLLHLPWTLVLADDLPVGRHTARIRIGPHHHVNSSGTALRVIHFLTNES